MLANRGGEKVGGGRGRRRWDLHKPCQWVSSLRRWWLLGNVATTTVAPEEVSLDVADG